MHLIEAELQSLLDHAAKTQDIITNACDAQSGYGSLEDADFIPSYVQRIKPMYDETFSRLLEYKNSRRHHWLGKDDVLHLIFEQSCSPTMKGSDAMTVSHVCRRFRQVALDTPILWSHLFSTESLLKTAEFLRRTKSAGLTVVVDDACPHDKERLRAFFTLLKPFCDRWVEFRYCPNDNDEWSLSNLKLLKEITGKIQLPRLRRLDIYCGKNEAEDFRPGEDSSICNDWWARELREVTCCCGHLDSWLSKSHLTLRSAPYSYTNIQPCSSALLEALAALPLLRFLELELSAAMRSSGPLAIAQLPSVKQLDISVAEAEFSESLRKLCSALRLPSLSTLFLVVSPLQDPKCFQEIFDCIAFNPPQCPSLEILHVQRFGVCRRSDGVVRPSFLLDSFFRSFPTVCHFSMNPIDLSASYREARVPKDLVTYSLACYELPQGQLEHLVKSLKAAPRYVEFKNLRISGYQTRELSRIFRDVRLKRILHIALDGNFLCMQLCDFVLLN